MAAHSDSDSDLSLDGDEALVLNACDLLSLFHGPADPLGPMFGYISAHFYDLEDDSDDDDPLVLGLAHGSGHRLVQLRLLTFDHDALRGISFFSSQWVQNQKKSLRKLKRCIQASTR